MRSGWERTRIADLVEPITTIDPRKQPDRIFTYIDVSSISRETFEIVETTQLKGADAPSRARRLVKQGDIIFATIRPTLQRLAEVPKALDRAVCSTGYFVLRPKPKVLTRFLFYSLFTPEFSDAMAELQRGAAYPAVSDADVRGQKLSAPPLPEQKRIVAILDEAFAGIATAVANTEKNLANARELFESYLNAVFSQRGEGWQERELSDVCMNLDSKRVPITKSKRKPGEIPYYGASGVVDHVGDYIFDENLLLVSEDGANLLARTYPIAFSISGKSWVNNHAHVLRFDAIESQRFIEYYLNAISLEPYVSGMAQPKLNQKALNSIKVPFPTVDQQKEVVDKLDEIAGGKKQLSDLYRQKLNALSELKQSLLQKAFSGELTAAPQEEIETALA